MSVSAREGAFHSLDNEKAAYTGRAVEGYAEDGVAEAHALVRQAGRVQPLYQWEGTFCTQLIHNLYSLVLQHYRNELIKILATDLLLSKNFCHDSEMKTYRYMTQMFLPHMVDCSYKKHHLHLTSCIF